MNATLDRGFKSWAERTATSLRGELGLSPNDLLRPLDLATYLETLLWTPHDVPNLPVEVLDQLMQKDPWGWSAVSVVQDGSAVIIYNPRHSPGRQSSDIVHELAHQILGHEPARLIMSHDGSFVMRSYDQKGEDEANWLAWAFYYQGMASLWVSKWLTAYAPHIRKKRECVGRTAEELQRVT